MGNQWELSIAMFDYPEGTPMYTGQKVVEKVSGRKCYTCDEFWKVQKIRFRWALCFLSESYFDNSALKFSMFATYQARHSNGLTQTDSTVEIVQERLALFWFTKHVHFGTSSKGKRSAPAVQLCQQ